MYRHLIESKNVNITLSTFNEISNNVFSEVSSKPVRKNDPLFLMKNCVVEDIDLHQALSEKDKYFPNSPYSSSKAAINAFTKSVANEIEGTNVKINTMSPGPCKTEMFPDNPLDPDAGIPTALMLASESEKLSNGKFFWMEKEVEVFADVSNIDWSDPNSI